MTVFWSGDNKKSQHLIFFLFRVYLLLHILLIFQLKESVFENRQHTIPKKVGSFWDFGSINWTLYIEMF